MTGPLATQFGDVGATIDRTLREHAERLAAHRERLDDQQNQLGAQNISLNAVRAEILGRIDTCELKVLQALEKVHQDVRLLLRAGANGHAS